MRIIKEVVVLKGAIIVALSIMLSVVVLLCGLTGCLFIVSTWIVSDSQVNDLETFLMHSESPDGEYVLEAYRTEPGATVDFSIRVYMLNENEKIKVYDAYHEYDIELYWINNSTVSINGKILDLMQGEKYNWRQ